MIERWRVHDKVYGFDSVFLSFVDPQTYTTNNRHLIHLKCDHGTRKRHVGKRGGLETLSFILTEP